MTPYTRYEVNICWTCSSPFMSQSAPIICCKRCCESSIGTSLLLLVFLIVLLRVLFLPSAGFPLSQLT